MSKLYKRKLRLKDRKKGFFFDSTEIREKLPAEVRSKKAGKKLKTFNCSNCPLDKGKYVPGAGDPARRIWWLGRDPGRTEIAKGEPFVGRAGKLLRRISGAADFGISNYGYIDNIVSCRPPGDTFNKTAAKCCYKSLDDKLEEHKPELIVTLGREATERILGFCDSMEAFNAIPIPSHKYNCIVIPLYHPSYVSRQGSAMLEHDYLRWIKRIKQYWRIIKNSEGFVDSFLKENSLNYKTREIKSIGQFREVAKLIKKSGVFSIDFENNTSKVYTEGSELFVGSLATWIIIGVKKKMLVPFGYWWKHSDYYDFWTQSERSEIEDILIDLCTDTKLIKVINNSKHEDNCLREHIGCELAQPIYCTMVNKHIINSSRKMTSLRTQALQAFGINYKFKTDAKLKPGKGQQFNRIKEIPIEELGERCSVDTVATLALREKQIKDIREEHLGKRKPSDNPTETYCIPFYARGIKTLTRYEQRGININHELLQELKGKWTVRMEGIDDRIGKMGTVKRFIKAHPKPFNINSKDQQRILLFDNKYFALEPMEGKVTAKKKVAQVDEEVLTFLANEQDNLFSKLLIERDKLRKLVNTYLLNIELYIGGDGRLHPDYWLHTARSFRSSSSKPNFQNFPSHYEIGEEDASEIRAVFIPSHPDWELRSVDYGGNELRGLWMLSRDTQLLEDINSGMNLHRYWASQLYEKAEDKVTPDEYWNGKNKFVFRSFYGGSSDAAAKDMDLSPFLVEDCQQRLFSRYWQVKNWQEDTIKFYRNYGYVELLTGFRSEGPMEREAIINRAIQGTSFHKLLHSCNEIEELKGYDTIAVGQIHDDILFDGPKSERVKHTKDVSDIMINLPWDWSKGINEMVEWKNGPNWKDMEEYEVVSRINN